MVLSECSSSVRCGASSVSYRRGEAPLPGLLGSRPVSRILSRVTIHLLQLPGSSAGRLGGTCSPCTGRGLASRRVATTLVGSYPTVSPLPATSPEITSQAVCFLCHCPSAFAASLAGASCPVVSGLSSTPLARRRGHPACEFNSTCTPPISGLPCRTKPHSVQRTTWPSWRTNSPHTGHS